MTWQRRIMVVEDEPLVATLLCKELEQAGFAVTSCGTAADARDLAEEFDPDAALIDINLGPGPSGLDLGQALHRAQPEIALVFLTRYFDPRANGGSHVAVPPGSSFLSKDRISDPAILLECLESTLREGTPHRHDLTASSQLAKLTKAQMETLRLITMGYTNSAIAQLRGTSERAVERRLREVYETLGIIASPSVNQRVEAVKRYIVEAGIPNSPEDNE